MNIIVGSLMSMALAIGTTLGIDTLEWARELLDTLDVENAEDEAFHDWHEVALTLAEDTLTWFEMGETQHETVVELAGGTSEMQIYAETVLALLGDSSITRWPEELPEAPSERRGDDEYVQELPPLKSTNISVYPNPSKNEFNVLYSLHKDAQQLQFEVFDVTGRRIRDVIVRNTHTGSFQIDLAPCSGLYLLRITADGLLINTRKLICVEQ